jgi:hypothetical protein
MDEQREGVGASPVATGLAGAEAPEPHSRLGPSDGIPSANSIAFEYTKCPVCSGRIWPKVYPCCSLGCAYAYAASLS